MMCEAFTFCSHKLHLFVGAVDSLGKFRKNHERLSQGVLWLSQFENFQLERQRTRCNKGGGVKFDVLPSGEKETQEKTKAVTLAVPWTLSTASGMGMQKAKDALSGRRLKLQMSVPQYFSLFLTSSCIESSPLADLV